MAPEVKAKAALGYNQLARDLVHPGPAFLLKNWENPCIGSSVTHWWHTDHLSTQWPRAVSPWERTLLSRMLAFTLGWMSFPLINESLFWLSKTIIEIKFTPFLFWKIFSTWKTNEFFSRCSSLYPTVWKLTVTPESHSLLWNSPATPGFHSYSHTPELSQSSAVPPESHRHSTVSQLLQSYLIKFSCQTAHISGPFSSQCLPCILLFRLIR